MQIDLPGRGVLCASSFQNWLNLTFLECIGLVGHFVHAHFVHATLGNEFLKVQKWLNRYTPRPSGN